MTSFQRKTGLGKGLSALLDDSDVAQATRSEIPDAREGQGSHAGIGEIDLNLIEINPYQPRTEFD
ncbi:MAG: chromosome partitioning protein ParB, partial [Chitinophagaceae bacterium]